MPVYFYEGVDKYVIAFNDERDFDDITDMGSILKTSRRYKMDFMQHPMKYIFKIGKVANQVSHLKNEHLNLQRHSKIKSKMLENGLVNTFINLMCFDCI